MKNNYTTGLLLSICTFFFVESLSAQFTLHTVTDPQLDGVRPSNIVSGPHGETLIMMDETIYTYDSQVTDVFECDLCNDIVDVAFFGGNMYIANETGGIVKRTGVEEEIVTSLRATRLLADSLGNFYGIHFLDGLVFSDGNDWIHMTTVNSGIPTDDIYDLAIDKSGILWMATYEGLVSWDWIDFTVIPTPGDLSTAFYDIVIDSSDNIWVASAFGGVGKYDRTEWTTYPQDFSPLQRIENLSTLSGDEVWTSESGEGLYRNSGTSFEFIHYSELGELDWDINRVLFGDSQDRLWIYNDFTPLKYLTVGPTSIVGDREDLIALSIHPNPASNEIFIKTEPGMNGEEYFVAVYSPAGVRVFGEQVSSKDNLLQFAFGHHPAGIYQVAIFEKGILKYSGRVSVQGSR